MMNENKQQNPQKNIGNREQGTNPTQKPSNQTPAGQNNNGAKAPAKEKQTEEESEDDKFFR